MYIAIGLIALFAEMIIACILKDFIMLGIIIITIGFLFLFSIIKGYAKIKGAAIFMTVYCFLWGMGMTGLSYPIYINPKNPNCFCISRMINKEWILLIMLGILFLFVSCNLMIGYFTI